MITIPLWEENSRIQKMRAESEVITSRRILINLVKVKFPNLTDLAEQQAQRLDGAGTLDYLAQKVAVIQDEQVIHQLLEIPRLEIVKEKGIVGKLETRHYSLWEEDLYLGRIRDEAELEAFQSALMTILEVRFPNLADVAQKQVEAIDSSDVIEFLIQKVVATEDENIVRFLLDLPQPEPSSLEQ